MLRQVIDPPQQVSDEHTLIAQRYAGYLVGRNYRAEQQGTVITLSRQHGWKEPNIVADDCEFCVRLTDDEAVRRVLGYQWQLDIEATRGKMGHYQEWTQRAGVDSTVTQENLRRFVVENQDVPRPAREGAWKRDAQPHGWRLRPLPMVDLPLRLKRKLCVEWNHLLRSWMIRDALSYDFENQVFYRDVEDEDVTILCNREDNHDSHEFGTHGWCPGRPWEGC